MTVTFREWRDLRALHQVMTRSLQMAGAYERRYGTAQRADRAVDRYFAMVEVVLLRRRAPIEVER